MCGRDWALAWRAPVDKPMSLWELRTGRWDWAEHRAQARASMLPHPGAPPRVLCGTLAGARVLCWWEQQAGHPSWD